MSKRGKRGKTRRRRRTVSAAPVRHYRRSRTRTVVHRRRRRGGGGGGGKLSLKSLPQILQRNAMPILLTTAGILAGRAVYGLVRQYQPDLHPGVAVAGGALGPGLVAVLAGLKGGIALPVLIGGIAGAGVDVARAPAAEALAEPAPQVASAIYNGMSLEPAAIAPASEPGPAVVPAALPAAPAEEKSWWDSLFSGDVPWSGDLGQTYLMP